MSSVQMCGKVMHLTYQSAHNHAQELELQYSQEANTYICKQCTQAAKRTIWHVGYGYDASKLSKSSRRRRKQAGRRKRTGKMVSRINGKHGRYNKKIYDRKSEQDYELL